MLQMYFFYNGVGKTDRVREYELMLRRAADGGSVVAKMTVNIFIDHVPQSGTIRDQLIFGLKLMKEKDQQPEYRDMWSNRQSVDAFATFPY